MTDVLEQFSPSWLKAVSDALAPIRDGDARQQVLERFHGKYLPAILSAEADHGGGIHKLNVATERAWESFRLYLVFPATSRKQFSLDEAAAEQVVASLKDLVKRAREQE